MKRYKNAPIDRGSTLILRITVALVGCIVLGICLFVLPEMIMTDKVGYYRPILIGMYVPAVPFFFGVYQTLKLLGYIDKRQAFSQLSVDALSKIKYAAFIISGIYMVGMPYIYYAADRDDAPGVVAIGLVLVGASFVVGTAAAVFQKLLQSAVDLKAENDLTV